MVDVGVGQHHVVDIVGGEIQLPVVPLIPALLQAAVDQHLAAAALDAVAAAGDRLGGAEKGQLHGNAPLL